MAKRSKTCKNCEFLESRTALTGTFSCGSKADFCGKLLDSGKTRAQAVIVLLKKCPLD